MSAGDLIDRAEVQRRLLLIFPDGTQNRGYVTREIAASTVFVALYVGAVEGTGNWFGPKHVYRMTDQQAARVDRAARDEYVVRISGRKALIEGRRWYEDNTREPIRDETLRDGLVATGAVVARDDVPTTSSRPRYALKAEFARLFEPDLADTALGKAIAEFRTAHLSPGALARVSIMLSGAASGTAGVLATFPNGETRQLAPGPSSVIAKAVVEVFAKRFLKMPSVLWLSESGAKVVHRDDRIANRIGLKIEAARNLPDLILADLGSPEPLLVFVEVVATDGAITSRRQDAIFALTDAAGFRRERVAFVTAYQDREAPGFRKTVHQLAWGSYAWFVSEPEGLVELKLGRTTLA